MLLLKKGYAYVPYSSIESIIEQSKEGYYRALRRTQRTIWTETVDYVPWISFFLTVLQKQKKILEEKTAQKNRKTTEKTTEKILKLVQENPTISQEKIAEIIGITTDGVYWNIKKLKQKGVLRREGPDKGGYWVVIDVITKI